jgi:hypothetical protein
MSFRNIYKIISFTGSSKKKYTWYNEKGSISLDRLLCALDLKLGNYSLKIH